MIGKPFAELGEIPSASSARCSSCAEPDGDAAAPARHARRASRSSSGGPRTSVCWARASTASRRVVEATAYPLFGADEEMHGVVTVFWDGARRSGVMRRASGDAAARSRRPGADTVRYGGNTSCVEVRARRAARRSCSTPAPACARSASTMDARAARRGAHPAHPPPPRPPQGLGFFRPLFRPGARSTSGARRRRCRAWPSASRSTSRRRCSRCGWPTSRRSITFHDAPEEPVDDRLRDGARRARSTHQGPTVGYRIEEDGRVARRTSRTTSRRSASTLADQPPTGSAGTTSPTAPTCCSTTPSTATTSTRPRRLGALRHRPRDGLRAQGRGRHASCCSTTTRTTPTTSSRRCSPRPTSSGRPITTWVCLADEGMVVTLDADGVQVLAASGQLDPRHGHRHGQ